MNDDQARAYQAAYMERAYRDGLLKRSEKFKATVMRAEDEGGRLAGIQIEHADGRVHATITPRIVRIKGKTKGSE